MLSGRTHNGGFQERIICYILYEDDNYIAFLFRNKSILILILKKLLLLQMIEVLQSRTITTLPNTVYTPESLQPEASKHDDFKKPTAAHGAPDPKGSEQSTTDDGELDPGAGEQHPRSYS